VPRHGILLVIGSEFFIQLRSFLFQLPWFLKERLGGSREKLRRVRCAIMVDHGPFALGRLLLQALKIAAEYQCPRAVQLPALAPLLPLAKRGRAVGRAVHLVELMGELVDHHVVAVKGVFAAALARVPSEHDRPELPRLAKAMMLLFLVVRMLREVRAGVNEDRAQRRVVGRLAVEQQDAGLRGDGHPDLVIDHKPAAALEHFLVEKNKDVPMQLPLVRRRELPVDGEVRFQDFRPGAGEISLPNFLPPSFCKKSKHNRSLNQPPNRDWGGLKMVGEEGFEPSRGLYPCCATVRNCLSLNALIHTGK